MNTPLGFKTPNSILGVDSVKVDALNPFGCLSWYKVPKANRKKLDPKAHSSILLSYLSDGNGFQVWDLNSKNVIKSRDVICVDDVYPYNDSLSTTPTAPTDACIVELPWPNQDVSAVESISIPVISSPPGSANIHRDCLNSHSGESSEITIPATEQSPQPAVPSVQHTPQPSTSSLRPSILSHDSATSTDCRLEASIHATLSAPSACSNSQPLNDNTP
jgi:hypothetical protein